jgi:hypothetical protein
MHPGEFLRGVALTALRVSGASWSRRDDFHVTKADSQFVMEEDILTGKTFPEASDELHRPAHSHDFSDHR